MFYGIQNEADLALFIQCTQTIARICQGGQMFVGDQLLTVQRNLGFYENERFMQAFTAYANTPQRQSMIWRLHLLTWAAENALHLPGDFVECGVWQGFSSAVVMHYLDFGQQACQFYLYDTFTGLPGQTWSPYQEAHLHHKVCTLFEPYPNVHIIPGIVPDSLVDNAPAQIAWLHLDMNSAEAEIGALDVLFERVVPGGYILLDDYGWYQFRAQKMAEEPFFRARGHAVVELPTGQGMVIKHGV